MVSASWLRRKSSNRSACQARVAGRTGEINGIAIVAAEEGQQPSGLRAAGAEMDVRDKQSAKAPFRTLFTHSVIPMRKQVPESRDSVMTVSRRRRNHALETDQRVDSERRDLAPFDEDGIVVGLSPRLQPRKRKFGPQPQLPGALRGPSLDRRGDAFFRIEMVDEDDPPAR